MLALDAERRAYAARLERWLALASDEELALERTLARLTRTQRARQALDRLARSGEPSRLSQPPVAVKRRKKRPASDKGDDDKENRQVQPQPQKGEDGRCKLQPRSQQQAPTAPAHAPPRPPLASLPQRSPPQPHRPPVPPPTPPPPFHRHPPPLPPFPAYVAGLQFALESERAAVRRLSSAYAQLETSYASLRASHAELQHRVYELQAKNVALWAMADG